MHISFSGVTTFKNAPRKYANVQKLVPFDRVCWVENRCAIFGAYLTVKRENPAIRATWLRCPKNAALGKSGSSNAQMPSKLFRMEEETVMNPVIVVEGRDDTRQREKSIRISRRWNERFCDWRRKTIAYSRAANTRSDCVYSFGYPGTRIRNIIQSAYPEWRSRQKDNHKSLGWNTQYQHPASARIGAWDFEVSDFTETSTDGAGFIGRPGARDVGGRFSKLAIRMENSSRKDYNYFGITEEQLRAALEAVLEKWGQTWMGNKRISRRQKKNARDYGSWANGKKSLGQNFLIEPNI